MHPRHDEAHENSDGDAGGSADEESQYRLRRRKRPGHGGGDREAINDDRRGVVDHAFALENGLNLSRHSQRAHHRQHRHRIRRRDDGAERERCRPGESGMQGVGDDGDRHRRHQHHHHRQTDDRADLALKLTQRKRDRPRVQQWWNEDEKQYFRRDVDFRQSRYERQQQPTEHQNRRVRNLQPLGDDT